MDLFNKTVKDSRSRVPLEGAGVIQAAEGGDRKVGGMGAHAIIYLDGKRFDDGFSAHAYLRDECGFSDKEAAQYLVKLSQEYVGLGRPRITKGTE